MTGRCAAAVAAALVAVLAGCTAGGDGDPGPSDTPAQTTPAPSPEPSPSPTATTEPGPVVVPVYYLVETRGGPRLAREQAEVTGDDPVRAAVERMISGPDDPDYTTAWNPATRVLGVERSPGAIVVDLSGEARTASIGSQGAAVMVQQLVHTATDAADDDTASVLLTIDGAPAGDLWGAESWTEPVTRDDPLSVRLLVQIDQPTEGATTTSPVTVSGEAAVFEANLLWSVLDGSGATVQSGFTTTAEGQTFAPYSFSVDLAPGTYTVVITEDDPSGGEAGPPMTDSRTITVS